MVLLNRFSINCYGKQPTLSSIRAEKAEKYRELKDKPDKREFQAWFLNYKPHATVKIAKNPNEKKLDKLFTPNPEDKEPTKEEVHKKIVDSIKQAQQILSIKSRTMTQGKTVKKQGVSRNKSSRKSKSK